MTVPHARTPHTQHTELLHIHSTQNWWQSSHSGAHLWDRAGSRLGWWHPIQKRKRMFLHKYCLWHPLHYSSKLGKNSSMHLLSGFKFSKMKFKGLGVMLFPCIPTSDVEDLWPMLQRKQVDPTRKHKAKIHNLPKQLDSSWWETGRHQIWQDTWERMASEDAGNQCFCSVWMVSANSLTK